MEGLFGTRTIKEGIVETRHHFVLVSDLMLNVVFLQRVGAGETSREDSEIRRLSGTHSTAATTAAHPVSARLSLGAPWDGDRTRGR